MRNPRIRVRKIHAATTPASLQDPMTIRQVYTILSDYDSIQVPQISY